MGLADEILDAVEILVENKVSGLQFNKTIRGKIAEVIDSSIGKYKIQYQNSYFTAYTSDSNATYQKGSEVYVEILSSDFEKNALIIGTVRRLGSNYITIVEELDKYYNIGSKIDIIGDVNFCSYDGVQEQNLIIDDVLAVEQYAAAADVMKLGMRVQNKLAPAQRAGGGNYGIKVVVDYYDEAYSNPKLYSPIERTYLFDINDMSGQPYKYLTASDQYTLFEIDPVNFKEIKSITAFCKDFPVEETGHDYDIWLTDINIQFMKALTEEQLQSTFLAIDTPKGNYFTPVGDEEKLLKADLRIKGKKVNYDAQQIDFYWFKRNLEIDSEDERFSAYGGNGWELLNKTSLNAYTYTLKKALCTTSKTEFKCVAVYSDAGQSVSISARIIIKNLAEQTLLSINSSMGTVFAFNIGKTRLTLEGYTKTNATRYCWTESINGGTAVYYNGEKLIPTEYIDVAIDTPAADTLTYECSVYEGGELLGSASIVLLNNKESLGYTLMLKDGQQIFKYDTYGTSPASQAVAAADRMTIPILSFDIYDKQGQLIDILDEDKIKYMSIKWLWPTAVDAQQDTMLTTKAELETITVRDIANNRTQQRLASVDKPTFTYGIRDVYNAELANSEASRNNIILEVDYQGEHLVASTNFAFTKEGELGTNGTKYIARIVPKTGYKEIFINGNDLYAAQYVNYAESAERVEFVNLGATKSLNDLFDVQLWDNQNNVIARASVRWSVASSTTRTYKERLTISQNNVTIRAGSESAYTCSNILQATITLDGVKYYATYPLIYTNGLNNNELLYIAGGYREVMYESDGTRGKFNGLPFEPKWLGGAGARDLPTVDVGAWNSSWGAAAAKVANSFNQFKIEPPSYYIGESAGHYIKLTYSNYYTYLPIELYLNRYGMSAMNDWDGSAIKIDNEGRYILAPQIGAGHKDNDNSFTGITIGEVFQDTGTRQTGMFGYYQGQRSLFLDAETGDAEFGVASEGQIKIRASDGQGTISDGHYKYDHTGGTGRGLKIKFTSTPKDSSDPNDEQGPYIKYGTGNFMVNANGHITAQGGGTIAGWKITDNYLRSVDNKTTLLATGGDNDKRIDINNKFIVYGDGRFSAANSKFSVDAEGNITAKGGSIGGWVINESYLQSADQRTTLYATGTGTSTRINVNNNFSVDANGYINSIAGTIGGYTIGQHELKAENDHLILRDSGAILGPAASYAFSPNRRVWEITPGGVAYFTDVKIQNKQSAGNSLSWTASNGANIFKLTDNGSFIGGWTITGNELSTSNFHINSAGAGPNNSVLDINSAFQIYGNGSFNASGGGQLGGCSIGAGGSGAVNFPAGVMQFGGETVTLNGGSFMGNISLTLTEEEDDIDIDINNVQVKVTLPGFTFHGGEIGKDGGTCTGTITADGAATAELINTGSAKAKGKKYKLTGSYSYTNSSTTKIMGTQWGISDVIIKRDGEWITNN